MPDHVHLCISIPPKYSVASEVGYLKGKSAITIARWYGGRKRNFTGETFWARGYFVSTVGLDEAMVRAYIRNQEIVGLYVSPPKHALVLCCDEKSQVQALDRTQPGVPLKIRTDGDDDARL